MPDDAILAQTDVGTRREEEPLRRTSGQDVVEPHTTPAALTGLGTPGHVASIDPQQIRLRILKRRDLGGNAGRHPVQIDDLVGDIQVDDVVTVHLRVFARLRGGVPIDEAGLPARQQLGVFGPGQTSDEEGDADASQYDERHHQA